MKSLTIEGKKRQKSGKSDAKASRRNGYIPCILYGGSENVAFTAPATSFKPLIYTPEFYFINLDIDGQTYKAVMKDIQFHPVSEKLLHVDFHELDETKKIITEIPVIITGLAEGMKEGGRQIQKIRKLKVKGYPKAFVDHIEVDVTHVKLGKSIKVAELKIEGLEFLDPKTSPVVSIEVQRLMKEDRIAEAEALAAAQAAAATAAAAAEGAPAEGAEPAKEGAVPEEKEKDKKKKKED